MAAHPQPLMSDIDVGIDPDLRFIIDTNINTIITAIQLGNKSKIPLFLLALLVDPKVMHYVRMFLRNTDKSGLTVDGLFSQDDLIPDSLNGNVVDVIIDLLETDMSEDDIDFSFVFYITAYGFTDHLYDILDYPISQYPKLPKEIFGFLLAGAYYRGRDDLIKLIRDNVEIRFPVDKTLDSEHIGIVASLDGRYIGATGIPKYAHRDVQDVYRSYILNTYKRRVIDQIGWIGVICSGRYSYLKEVRDFAAHELPWYLRGQTNDIIRYHLFFIKSNLEKMLTSPVRAMIKYRMMQFFDLILKSYDVNLIQWFLTNDEIGKLYFDYTRINYETWLFIYKHKDAILARANDRLAQIINMFSDADSAYNFYTDDVQPPNS